MLKVKHGIHIGTMDSSMTPGGPAGTSFDEFGVRDLPNKYITTGGRTGNLSMTFEAEVVVALYQELAID
jgi:hypothetical protein